MQELIQKTSEALAKAIDEHDLQAIETLSRCLKRLQCQHALFPNAKL
jgi:hypothetical protein